MSQANDSPNLSNTLIEYFFLLWHWAWLIILTGGRRGEYYMVKALSRE